MFLIIALSIIAKGELSNKTINYYTEIKAKSQKRNLSKRGSPGKSRSLSRVSEEGVQDKVRWDCQLFMPNFTEKGISCQKNHHRSDKFNTCKKFLKCFTHLNLIS